MHIIKEPEAFEDMGKAAREYVRENFLVTRLIKDYFKLAAEMIR